MQFRRTLGCCTYTALKRKGYVLPNNTVSLPLVSRLKLLPPWLFWPDSLSKDLNEYDIFYFPEGFGKNSQLLLRYFNSYNFIPQAYRPGNSLFECPFKRNWNPHVYFPHTLYVNRLGKILRLSGIVHYYNYYILCTFWRCVSNKYKGSCSSELFKFFT